MHWFLIIRWGHPLSEWVDCCNRETGMVVGWGLQLGHCNQCSIPPVNLQSVVSRWCLFTWWNITLISGHSYLVVNLGIDRIIVLDCITWILVRKMSLQFLNHNAVITVHVDCSIWGKYHWVQCNVVVEETQNHINAVDLSRSGVHVDYSSGYMAFSAPYFQVCPDSPCAHASAIRVDCNVTH